VGGKGGDLNGRKALGRWGTWEELGILKRRNKERGGRSILKLSDGRDEVGAFQQSPSIGLSVPIGPKTRGGIRVGLSVGPKSVKGGCLPS